MLFLLSIAIITLARASAHSASLLLEWLLVLLLFAGLAAGAWLIRRALRRPRSAGSSNVRLNPRERDVLLLVADGLSNAEIAERLHRSESTVKKHVSSLYRKLGAKRRTDAVRIASESGLLNGHGETNPDSARHG